MLRYFEDRNRLHQFIIDKTEVSLTDKAIRLPICRKGQSAVVEHQWFPLSCVQYTERGLDYVVKIPDWLCREKFGNSFTVGRR